MLITIPSVVLCSLAAASSSAQALSVTDQAGFIASLDTYQTETFQTLSRGSLSVPGIPNQLGLLTATSIGNRPATPFDFSISEFPAGNFRLHIFLDAEDYIHTVRIDFPEPVNAFGATFFMQNGGTGLDITINNVTTHIDDNTPGISPIAYEPTYLAATTDEPFTSIELSGHFFNFNVDDITFGTVATGASDCPADVNNDGAVTPTDFGAWLAAFNASAPGCDQNNDDACTPTDFGAWLSNFNAGCE